MVLILLFLFLRSTDYILHPQDDVPGRFFLLFFRLGSARSVLYGGGCQLMKMKINRKRKKKNKMMMMMMMMMMNDE